MASHWPRAPRTRSALGFSLACLLTTPHCAQAHEESAIVRAVPCAPPTRRRAARARACASAGSNAREQLPQWLSSCCDCRPARWTRVPPTFCTALCTQNKRRYSSLCRCACAARSQHTGIKHSARFQRAVTLLCALARCSDKQARSYATDRAAQDTRRARACRPSTRLGDEIMLVGLLDGSLHALDPTNGQQLWEFSTGAPLVTSHTQDSLVSATSDAPDFFPGVDGRLYHISEDDRSLEARCRPAPFAPWIACMAANGSAVKSQIRSRERVHPREPVYTPSSRPDPATGLTQNQKDCAECVLSENGAVCGRPGCLPGVLV